LSELHALSETLDSAMGLELESASITRAGYFRAWQQVGRPQDRERQVALTLAIAERLDRFTRQPLFRTGLHLMRGPALAAGPVRSAAAARRGLRHVPCAAGCRRVHRVGRRA